MKWLNLASQKLYPFPIIALLIAGCASPMQHTNRDSSAKTQFASNVYDAYSPNWDENNLKAPTSADSFDVQAKVIIAKDGKVESANIVKPSGNRLIDESVKKTLDRIKFVQPFEAGAKDKRRTFIIHFNLKPKTS